VWESWDGDMRSEKKGATVKGMLDREPQRDIKRDRVHEAYCPMRITYPPMQDPAGSCRMKTSPSDVTDQAPTRLEQRHQYST
jgi:hypothetical protein